MLSYEVMTIKRRTCSGYAADVISDNLLCRTCNSLGLPLTEALQLARACGTVCIIVLVRLRQGI